MPLRIQVDDEALARWCKAHHVRRLSIFGSVLRDDFTPTSDVDVLVEFEAGHTPGLMGLSRMERDLSPFFGGRKVDLRTPHDLSRYFRAEVLAEAELRFAAG